jgi:hypothetical protein
MGSVAFINRTEEMHIFHEMLRDLLRRNRLLRTPVIGLYGIEGIGKSQILLEMMQECKKNNIACIKSEVDRSWQVEELITSFRAFYTKYTQQSFLPEESLDNLQHLIQRTKTFLEQEPLVMLLDSIDLAGEDQRERLEYLLSELLFYNNLVVILTSSRDISFEHDKSVARKLKTIPVRPFTRTDTEEYMARMGYVLPSPLSDMVFQWTRGYPLALQVMLEAMTQRQLEPTHQRQRKELIDYIIDRVINQRILAGREGEDLTWFQTMLRLLSVPRRFNLVIMQRLIERFAPEARLASSLAYMTLPKKIIQATSGLSWDLKKAGFAMDDSLRNLLLLHLRFTNLRRYHAIHRFLAELNRAHAEEVTGSDRIRYQQEYLYHLASDGNQRLMPSLVRETIVNIVQDAQSQPDRLLQFREAIQLDDELKEALGMHMTLVLDLLEHRTSAQE